MSWWDPRDWFNSGGGSTSTYVGTPQTAYSNLNYPVGNPKRTAAPTYNPGATSAAAGGAGSDLGALYAKLLKSMGGGYNAPSEASLEAQARAAVGGQYDPQINAILRASTAAKKNAAYSSTAIGKLFKGLAESYQGDIKDTHGLFKQAKAHEKATLKDYSNEIKANYGDSMQALTDSYKQLGIEAAAGDSTIGALAKDEASNLQKGSKDSQVEQKALNQQETGDVEYWQKGAGTAKMEGTQRQGDLSMALNSLLTDNSGKVEDLKAQKQQAYNSALAQLQAEVQKQAAAQNDKTWSQLLQLGNFQMSVGKYNKSMQAQPAAAAKFGSGLSGSSNYLYQQFVNSQWGPQEGERYASVIQGMILQLPPGITPEAAAKAAAEEARRRGMSDTVMARAMLAYYGKA